MELIELLLFPGFALLLVLAMAAEYLDRKVVARMQNRVGPPWYQPAADCLKLLGKQALTPAHAKKLLYRALPLVSLASAAAAYLCIPVWGKGLTAYEGDLVVVLYLLTVPTICLFLAGWGSGSVYSIMGAFRTMTQMFAYEVPLFMAFLSPAILADTWSLSGILMFYQLHPWWTLLNLPAFLIALLAVQIKLSRAPFDAPEAETEIVGGATVEYGGRYLALFRLSADCELVILISVMAAVFLPFTTGVAWADFLLYLAQALVLLLALSALRVPMARLRLDQTLDLCWKVLTPLAIVQLVVDLMVKGAL